MKRPQLSLVVFALAFGVVALGCSSTQDDGAAPPEPTTAGEETTEYTVSEVIAAVDGWPSGWPGAGDVSTAINAVCQGAAIEGGEITIHPFEVSRLDSGRWQVTTACDYSSSETESSSISFEWVFFEQGPRLEPSGGRAADVTGN